MNRLAKRLDALEASRGYLPFCWLRAAAGEDAEAALARHVAQGGCTSNSGGHVVWRAAR